MFTIYINVVVGQSKTVKSRNIILLIRLKTNSRPCIWPKCKRMWWTSARETLLSMWEATCQTRWTGEPRDMSHQWRTNCVVDHAGRSAPWVLFWINNHFARSRMINEVEWYLSMRKIYSYTCLTNYAELMVAKNFRGSSEKMKSCFLRWIESLKPNVLIFGLRDCSLVPKMH